MDNNSSIIDCKMSSNNMGRSSNLCVYILLAKKNGSLKLIKMIIDVQNGDIKYD